jgi:signal transduction histidine kinase
MTPITRSILALAAALLAPGVSLADRAVQVLDSAHVVLDPSPEPPSTGDPRWQAVALPDRWRELRPGRGGFAWYRFSVPGPLDVGETLGVWLPNVNMNAAVFVNGTPVGSGGRFEEPVAHNFNRPLYFAVPSSLLSRTGNTIDVRLYAIPHHHGMLGPIHLGPDSLLRPLNERRELLQVGLSQLATVLALLMVIVVGAFWMGARFDPVYGLFALTALAWSVASLNYWVRDIPVGDWTWERLIHMALVAFVVALALWTHRFMGLERARVERALLAYGAAAALVIALLPVPRFYPTVSTLHIASFGIGAYATGVVLRRLGDLRPWERMTYALGGVLGLAFAAHDLALQFRWLPATAPYLLAYLLPVVMLAFGSTLIGRFVRSLSASERLNIELEARVHAKQAELERNFERLREVERARLLARERERIMQEMHDGLGGRLASTLAMVELGRGGKEDVAASLRGALEDMRLVIDSLDPHVHALPELLGMLRSRLAPLLRHSGLQLEWQVGEVPPLAALGPEGHLDVLRIVQEAVTNAIKHSGARRVTLATRWVDGPEPEVCIEVRDDGRGLDNGAAAGGRGLHNMRERANRLGGALAVDAGDPGTVVTLRLPASGQDATPGS